MWIWITVFPRDLIPSLKKESSDKYLDTLHLQPFFISVLNYRICFLKNVNLDNMLCKWTYHSRIGKIYLLAIWYPSIGYQPVWWDMIEHIFSVLLMMEAFALHPKILHSNQVTFYYLFNPPKSISLHLNPGAECLTLLSILFF